MRPRHDPHNRKAGVAKRAKRRRNRWLRRVGHRQNSNLAWQVNTLGMWVLTG